MGKRTIVLALSAILALMVGTGVALAAVVSLAGSNFEIDSDANTTVEGGAGALDWNNVSEIKKEEAFTGAQDDSFGQGTKESTTNPTIVDGGIPPNKSDLEVFGLYQEGTTSTGFLNLYWTRVQDPTGTTNMDFELNQKQCTPGQTPADPDCSSNGITPLRSTGDVLIIYDLSNGGTNASISFRTWQANGTWSGLTDLTAQGKAVGTINTSPIAATDSGGLGALDPRTFGEAQVALSALFGSSTNCTSFGSAYLKSRSSDSFTAALKDFIAPVPVSITNCGSVNITKTDDATPANALNGAEFTLFKDNAPLNGNPPHGAEDTATSLKCTTSGTGADAGKCTISNVPFGQYWVVETVTPSGYTTAPDQNVIVSAASSTVNVSFVDPRARGAILITKNRKHAADGAGDHPQSGVPFTVKDSGGNTVGTGTTNASGQVCVDNLLFGSYTVSETVPTGYQGEADKTVTVDNASPAGCTGTGTNAPESVTFHNTPLTDITVTVDSKVEGGTASTIDCDAAADPPFDKTVPATSPDNGDGSFTLSNKVPGTYTCTIVVDP